MIVGVNICRKNLKLSCGRMNVELLKNYYNVHKRCPSVFIGTLNRYVPTVLLLYPHVCHGSNSIIDMLRNISLHCLLPVKVIEPPYKRCGVTPHFPKTKRAAENFVEAGSAITINNGSRSQILTVMAKYRKRYSEEQIK